VIGTLKVDSQILQYDAARHETAARWGRKAWLLFTNAASSDSESKMAVKNLKVSLALAYRNHVGALALLQVEENECNKLVNKLRWKYRSSHNL